MQGQAKYPRKRRRTGNRPLAGPARGGTRIRAKRATCPRPGRSQARVWRRSGAYSRTIDRGCGAGAVEDQIAGANEERGSSAALVVGGEGVVFDRYAAGEQATGLDLVGVGVGVGVEAEG